MMPSVEILLVEDNPADARLAREALGASSVSANINVTRDGMEALALLRRATPYAHAPRPDVILLDLNLPRKNGREVLGEIKADAMLRCIPVVVLTTSNAPQDIQAAYAGHANAYLTKPLGPVLRAHGLVQPVLVDGSAVAPGLKWSQSTIDYP